ncbi:MAG: hypothetical protein QOH93_2832 [Chloroflexia bacterium]|nr:hypothetical protein [Chloroflexia bacterium]
MTEMAEKEPVAEQMLRTDDPAVIPWTQVRDLLTTANTQWLTTVRPDGRPHIRPVGPVWVGGAMYFTTGQGTRKGANLARNTHCAIAFANGGLDIVIEGLAVQVKDQATIERLAEVYTSQGWPATAGDGALDAPYDVYKITPTVAFCLGTTEETAVHTTRDRF